MRFSALLQSIGRLFGWLVRLITPTSEEPIARPEYPPRPPGPAPAPPDPHAPVPHCTADSLRRSTPARTSAASAAIRSGCVVRRCSASAINLRIVASVTLPA